MKITSLSIIIILSCVAGTNMISFGQHMDISSISPLKQFKSGTAIQNIQCGSYHTLVTKTSDGSPACLKFTTAQLMIKRGWSNDAFIAIMEPHYGGIAGQNGTGSYIIDVRLEKPNQTTFLLFHIFYPNGTQYKMDSIPTSDISLNNLYKYDITLKSNSDQPTNKGFRVQITYGSESRMIYLPSICCDIPTN